jgi:single-stranded DNA-binding protein
MDSHCRAWQGSRGRCHTQKGGDTIRVEGRLSLDKWRSSDGADKYGLSVVAAMIEKRLPPLNASGKHITKPRV